MLKIYTLIQVQNMEFYYLCLFYHFNQPYNLQAITPFDNTTGNPYQKSPSKETVR